MAFLGLPLARGRSSAPLCSLAPMNPPPPLLLAQDSCAYDRVSLALGRYSFLLRSTLCLCLLKVLIAHDFRIL
ncbi:hypothetical protein CC78DRAFT_528868 [Lojkania enalia]|uniref:Uncharacterized protein n=1 Tax=Lojkania enalia TaxID=147567 RepID=A0A9P4TQT3_9PLEO|nr:hypothetical protein CC78DRAFT_528868 [Didymosphaeria enalia]